MSTHQLMNINAREALLRSVVSQQTGERLKEPVLQEAERLGQELTTEIKKLSSNGATHVRKEYYTMMKDQRESVELLYNELVQLGYNIKLTQNLMKTILFISWNEEQKEVPKFENLWTQFG